MNETVLAPVALGVTAIVLSAEFMFPTVPSKVTVEDPDAPDTSVVEPAVYAMVPALEVNVARTISPLAQVEVGRNVVPSPRLRADAAVAARELAKSRLVTVREDTGSNSTIEPMVPHVLGQSFQPPAEPIMP